MGLESAVPSTWVCRTASLLMIFSGKPASRLAGLWIGKVPCVDRAAFTLSFCLALLRPFCSLTWECLFRWMESFSCVSGQGTLTFYNQEFCVLLLLMLLCVCFLISLREWSMCLFSKEETQIGREALYFSTSICFLVTWAELGWTKETQRGSIVRRKKKKKTKKEKTS